MSIRSIIPLAVLTSLTACQSYYSQPDPPVPSAELHVVSAHRGSGSNNFWYAYSTETCEDKDGDGLLGNFSSFSGSDKTVRIPAGQRFYLNGQLLSHSAYATGDTVQGTTNQCRSVASFVPEASRKYEATQGTSVHNCQIQIVDAETHAAPPTFEVHELKGNCDPH